MTMTTEPREFCLVCRRAQRVCQCADIRPFDVDPVFAILIHPIERRMKTGTGRMAHLSLKNSVLIEGENFENCSRVNELIRDPSYYPVVLYPGQSSVDVAELSVPTGRRLLIFVIDGTWNLAKKMLRLSPNLAALPQVRFTPSTPSGYRFRRQPAPECLSTIEAIHHVLEAIDPGRCEHAHLLSAFGKMVERQLKFSSNHRDVGSTPDISSGS